MLLPATTAHAAPLSAKAGTAAAGTLVEGKPGTSGVGLAVPITLTLVFGLALVVGLVLDQRDSGR
jgi:hypothetical protein